MRRKKHERRVRMGWRRHLFANDTLVCVSSTPVRPYDQPEVPYMLIATVFFTSLEVGISWTEPLAAAELEVSGMIQLAQERLRTRITEHAAGYGHGRVELVLDDSFHGGSGCYRFKRAQ